VPWSFLQHAAAANRCPVWSGRARWFVRPTDVKVSVTASIGTQARHRMPLILQTSELMSGEIGATLDRKFDIDQPARMIHI
jgi:hypothetical protein